MRRHIITAFALALCAIASIAGKAQPSPPATNNLRVTLTPAADGIDAHFALDRPVDRFEFANDANEIRDQTWTIVTPGVVQNAWSLTAKAGALSAFDVHIAPRNEQSDASYPCVFRIQDRSYGLYASYFAGRGIVTTLTFDVPADGVVLGLPIPGNTWRIDANMYRQPGHRYLYVGSRALVAEHAQATYVAPQNLPGDIRRRVETRVEQALTYFTARVGKSLRRKPLVIFALGSNPNDPSGMQGDVTFGPAVALRMFGASWTASAPGAADETHMREAIDHGVVHEVAHFWNSASFTPVEVVSGPWIHEGGGEYWALRGRMAFAGFTKNDARQDLEKALNTCVANLGASNMDGPRNAGTYACGQTAQWIADRALSARSAGHQDIFTLWNALFSHAEENGGAYTTKQFVALAEGNDENAKALLELFLTQQGGDRWSTLPVLAAKVGIKLSAGALEARAVRRVLVRHLLRQACGEQTQGLDVRKDDMKLDTGDRCGPLSGDPIVDSINGKNLFTQTDDAYAAVEEACRTHARVTFAAAQSSDAPSMICEKPLPPKLFAFHVEDAGF